MGSWLMVRFGGWQLQVRAVCRAVCRRVHAALPNSPLPLPLLHPSPRSRRHDVDGWDGLGNDGWHGSQAYIVDFKHSRKEERWAQVHGLDVSLCL
jgi:hypothetical protein